jgi:hypothetical protein
MRFFLFFSFFFLCPRPSSGISSSAIRLGPGHGSSAFASACHRVQPEPGAQNASDAVARWRDPLHSSRKRAGGAGLALFSSPNFLHQFLTLIRIIKYELMIKSIS